MRSTETAPANPADRPGIAAAKPTARSRITNGKQLFVGVDGRSRDARRWRDIYMGFMSRTGGQHEQLCRSLASLTLKREVLDAAIARGEPVDALDLVRLCGAISRTMARCGLVAEPGDDRTAPADMTDAAIASLRASP